MTNIQAGDPWYHANNLVTRHIMYEGTRYRITTVTKTMAHCEEVGVVSDAILRIPLAKVKDLLIERS